MDFSHFTPSHVLLRGFKNSITFLLKPYLQRYPITLQMRCQTSRSYITLWILFSVRSHSRLMIAVSYNLWISADHRCWLVGWGAFLIKRQMSGGGILTLWHYKSWHRFKILGLLCCPMRLREKIGAKSNTPLPNSSQWRVGLSSPSSQLFVPTSVLQSWISRSGRG